MTPSEKQALRALCVECGPNVRIDEDGCCAYCGNGAVGTWLDEAQGIETLAVNSAIASLRSENESLRKQLDDYHRAVSAQLHYDAHSILTGTPEERARSENESLKAALREACDIGQWALDGVIGEVGAFGAGYRPARLASLRQKADSK